jgi:hypothetical protein
MSRPLRIEYHGAWYHVIPNVAKAEGAVDPRHPRVRL